MKKTLYALIIGGLMLGSTMLVAKTGVLVHEKDGTTTFYPSDEVEYVEFVEEYEPENEEEPGIPENPGEEEPGPEQPGEGEPQDPSEGENPGENQGEPENPSEPQEPDNGGDTNQGDQGSNEGQQPSEPGNSEDNNPGNSGGQEQQPGNGEDKEEPGKEDQPTQPADKNFYLYSGSSIEYNQTYLIVANGVCATPLDATNSYGYLPSSKVSIMSNKIEGNEANGYQFLSSCNVNGTTYSAPAGKFLIKDSQGRYLYLTGTYQSFNVGAEPEIKNGNIIDNYLFTASKRSDNTWTITNTKDGDTRYVCYSTKFSTFAAYNSLSSNDIYPYLFIQGSEFAGSGDTTIPDVPDTPQQTEPAPDGYKFPLSYVKLPEGTPQQVKEYTSYTLNFNKDNHTANYVAWELLDTETSGSASKPSYWVDREIEGCLDTDFGYNTYKYERGHLCPAADNKWSSAAIKDCMSMANMCPMLAELNGKMWATLEDKCRKWANRDGAIWIVTGPLYSSNDKLYVGKAQARVASSYFKAILYYNGSNSRAIAFVMQNGSNPGDLSGYAMSIDDLEKLTGYDFFSSLPDDIEQKVEATFSFSDWN